MITFNRNSEFPGSPGAQVVSQFGERPDGSVGTGCVRVHLGTSGFVPGLARSPARLSQTTPANEHRGKMRGAGQFDGYGGGSSLILVIFVLLCNFSAA